MLTVLLVGSPLVNRQLSLIKIRSRGAACASKEPHNRIWPSRNETTARCLAAPNDLIEQLNFLESKKRVMRVCCQWFVGGAPEPALALGSPVGAGARSVLAGGPSNSVKIGFKPSAHIRSEEHTPELQSLTH